MIDSIIRSRAVVQRTLYYHKCVFESTSLSARKRGGGSLEVKLSVSILVGVESGGVVVRSVLKLCPKSRTRRLTYLSARMSEKGNPNPACVVTRYDSITYSLQ